jgi:radical SAM superfamily enzyme YgiQ (UPF0313 family)
MNALIFGLSSGELYYRATGAYRIASILRNNNVDTEVIDFFSMWTEQELLEIVKKKINNNTIIVGFSILFFNPVQAERIKILIDYIKKNFPSVKIIVGGQHAKKYKFASHFIVDGFGDYAISEIIEFIKNPSHKLKYQLSGTGAKIVLANLDYPAFPMSDLSIRYQKNDYILPQEQLTVELGRGCKFKCDYCTFPVLGVKGDYSRSAVNFVEQLEYLNGEFGVNKFSLADETVNDSTDKLKKFAGAIQTLTFEPWFQGYIRADLMISRGNELAILEDMRLLGHEYGIESFNHTAARGVKKGMDPDKVKQGLVDTIFKLSKTGLYRGAYNFIIGLPGESKDSVKDAMIWSLSHLQGHAVSFRELLLSATHKDSKIEEDPEKYGYRRTDLDVSDKVLWKNIVGGFDHFIPWENDQMSIIDAINFREHWEQAFSEYRAPGGWMLGSVNVIYPELSLSQIISRKTVEFNLTKQRYREKLYKEYISKKLS